MGGGRLGIKGEKMLVSKKLGGPALRAGDWQVGKARGVGLPRDGTAGDGDR